MTMTKKMTITTANRNDGFVIKMTMNMIWYFETMYAPVQN